MGRLKEYRNNVVAMVSAALLSMVFSSTSYAFTCPESHASGFESIRDYDAIFIGTVLKDNRTQLPADYKGPGWSEYDMQVLYSWAGFKKGQYVKVWLPEYGHSYPVVGQHYLLGIINSTQGMEVEPCGIYFDYPNGTNGVGKAHYDWIRTHLKMIE